MSKNTQNCKISLRETVAGLFGCAVERSSAKSHVAEFLAITGACGNLLDVSVHASLVLSTFFLSCAH